MMEEIKKPFGVYWLAVNPDGKTGIISYNKEGLVRFDPMNPLHHKYFISWNDANSKTPHWIEHHAQDKESSYFAPRWILVPKEWVDKIVGKEMSWEDEPVLMVSDLTQEGEDRIYDDGCEPNKHCIIEFG